jgi:acyl-coenzyme A thioesterase PaaI-like protein
MAGHPTPTLAQKPHDHVHSRLARNPLHSDAEEPMHDPAFQDYYPDELSHCYGCGRLNEQGLQLKSRWDGEESVAFFTPRPYHTAIPGYVYGGLLASLIDCHGTGTASAAAYRAAGRPLGSEPALRFVTAALHVNYLRPTPLGGALEIRGRVKEIRGRKVVVEAWISADGNVCVRGEVVAVQLPEELRPAPPTDASSPEP